MTAGSDIPRRPSQGTADRAAGQLAGRHILLAEDSPDQQRLFATLLQHAGAEVTLECNGEAAVAAVAADNKAFDAVIMDFIMPVMDGVEATRRLRSGGFQRPIVAITAHGCDINEGAWLTAGADTFLRKPVDFVGLVSVLERLTQATHA